MSQNVTADEFFNGLFVWIEVSLSRLGGGQIVKAPLAPCHEVNAVLIYCPPAFVPIDNLTRTFHPLGTGPKNFGPHDIWTNCLSTSCVLPLQICDSYSLGHIHRLY